MVDTDLDLFRGIAIFVAAAEEKSFRKAGVRLGVSAAAVSKAVQKLEREAGIKLFTRGPRAAVLTAEGDSFFGHCKAAVLAVKAGRAVVDAKRKQPHGELVVSVPFIATSLVVPAFRLLRDRYPKLSYQLRVTDRLAKLGEERVDVAIRIGQLEDSGLVARKVASTMLLTIASPAYVERAGSPRSVDDLTAHACVNVLAPSGKPYPWFFKRGPTPVEAILVVDYGPAALDAALAGLGITQALDFMAEPHVRAGRLVTLLSDQVGRGPDVFVVCSPGRQSAAKVRAAFDAFAEALAKRE